MPLKIALDARDSGSGMLLVEGLPEDAPEVLIAVQRASDARYLTVHGLWVQDASWHPCSRADGPGAGGEARFRAGPALVAGVLAAVGETLEAHVRRGDFSDSGGLAVRGPAPERAPEPVPEPAPAPRSERTPEPKPGPAREQAPAAEPAPTMPRPEADAEPTVLAAAATDDTLLAPPRPEPSEAPWGPSAPRPERPTALEPPADLSPEPAPPVAPVAPPPRLEPLPEPSAPPRAAPARPQGARWLTLLLVVGIVLGVIGLGIWLLVRQSVPAPGPSQPGPATVPRVPPRPQVEPPVPIRPPVAPVGPVAPRQPPPQPPAPPARPLPTGIGGQTGKALFVALKQRNLAPAALFDYAEQADGAGDCEAAIRLFIDAAKGDPALAERLAAHYDPDGFKATPCFPAPKPDSALVWYQRAAEQDLPRAQRRYGELLLGESASGPLYQDALDWLRKAAAAGDKAAAQRLDALGEH